MTDPALIEHFAGATFVYFLAPLGDPPDRIKIGITENLAARKSAIEAAAGEPFEYLWALAFEERAGAQAIETQMHQQLAEYRIRGEWFKFCPGVVSVIPFLEHQGTQILRREHLR